MVSKLAIEKRDMRRMKKGADAVRYENVIEDSSADKRIVGFDVIESYSGFGQREAFAAAGRGPRLRGRLEAAPEGMAACGQSLEGFAQMQCSQPLGLGDCRYSVGKVIVRSPSCSVQVPPRAPQPGGSESLSKPTQVMHSHVRF